MKPTKFSIFNFQFSISCALTAAVLLGACTPKKQQPEDFLKHALENVERIKVAGYELEEKVKAPYEKDWSDIRHNRFVEQDNPQDTTIGASALRYSEDGRIFSVYDGTNLASFNHDERRIVVEDFQDAKSQALPFRMYHPPFFNYVKSLIRYMQTTTDSISLDVKETDEDFIYKLSIYENCQVEFFGRAYKMPENPFILSEEDAYSYYTLWISKTDAMPYRYLREMSHNVQDVTCHHAEWSEELTTSPIVATDLILLHGSYKVHYVGRRDMDKEAQQNEQLIGKAAPEWTLKDMDGKSVTLSTLRGKPTIINLTGLGCGPCAQAYPELVELSKRYNIVSIESWGKSAQSLRDYAAHHKITYPMLLGEDAVLNAYVGTSRAVPVFFYLDENHIVRKVDRGYAKGMIGRSTEELGWE